MMRNGIYASERSNFHENLLCCVFPMFSLCFPHVSLMSLCYDFLTQCMKWCAMVQLSCADSQQHQEEEDE